jgi:hypothetical protein
MQVEVKVCRPYGARNVGDRCLCPSGLGTVWRSALRASSPHRFREKTFSVRGRTADPSAALLMTQCRTYGARILFGIDSPALPGWADVWRSAPSTSSGQALRASHPCRFPVSFLSQFVAGNLAARDDKGEGVSFDLYLVLDESTAGPHSTSLRAGSPLRYALVGMTIHIWVRDASAQEKLSSENKVTSSERSASHRRERPWRVRQVRAGRLKAPNSIGRISILGVPSATFGTGSSTPRHQALWQALSL